jgi:transcriptional regulator with XRE-family HTH domain
VTRNPAPTVADALRELLIERKQTLRAFAAEVGVSQAHLTRVIQGKKRATPELAERIAVVLQLPADYFAEVRESVVIDAVLSDSAFRERLYRQITKR